MANLPQVLDQNYIMGAHISDPTLLVLQVGEMVFKEVFLIPFEGTYLRFICKHYNNNIWLYVYILI